MQQVAEHLSSKAMTLNGVDADAFARSAFNRYYYATYLSVRELLALLDSKWASQPHKGIPELLEKALTKRVKDQAKVLQSNGALNKSEEQALIRQANQASSDIADVLRIAYGVRIVADYEPSQLVEFQKSAFCLAKHSEAEARNWKTRVDRAKGVIMRVSKEVGLV